MIREAGYGVCFLDEFGDLSPKIQANLLTVLVGHEVLPVGADVVESIHAMLICATNRDLEGMIAAKEFRADLLNRFPRDYRLHIKPLAERKEDIMPIFAHRLFGKYSKKRKGIPGDFMIEVDKGVIYFLLGQSYGDGNVRELLGLIDHMISQNPDMLELNDSGHLRVEEKHIPDEYRRSMEFGKYHGEGIISFRPHLSEEDAIARRLSYLNAAVEKLAEGKGVVTCDQLIGAIETADCLNIIRKVNETSPETKENMKGIFRPLQSCKKMATGEKHELMRRLGWQSDVKKDIAALFDRAAETIYQWQKGNK